MSCAFVNFELGSHSCSFFRPIRAETNVKCRTAQHERWRLWCGECGPHNDGGLAGKTDRFMSSLWYADALGGLARLGLAEFGRQARQGVHRTS